MTEAMPAESPPPQGRWRHLLSLRAFTLLVATALSLLGSLGQFLFLEGLDGTIGARAAEMRGIESRVATLRTTQNEYFNAYVQGNLIFALDPANVSANRGVTGKMYQLALYDRAFPFRAIMAELAIAGTFTFKPVNDEYKSLSDEARATLSFASYNALNEFEKKILDQALNLQHTLQDRYFAAETEKAAAEAQRDRRRLLMTILTALGTCLLLGANLMAEPRNG